jgi:uncharacterized membrane protein
MADSEVQAVETDKVKKLPVAAAIVALVGIADAVYLTIHHLTTVPVPCSLMMGCEVVLTSPYAEIAGIPIAAFGALAYFVAFSLAILAAFGNRIAWNLFGVQMAIMAAVTCWLLYLQAFVLNAFCQFCLVSALATFTLLAIFIFSKFLKK